MLRWVGAIAALLLALMLLAAAVAWWLLRGSLPALDGELALPGLAAPVSVQRDALGVVTIDARDERDALRALGYVHAQERYFEMDLLRRTSAGELAALFGPVALDVDRRNRMHRMRARVEAGLEAIAGERMPLLLAYAEGVNAGLAALRMRPWPYLLLRQAPQPWRPADTALAGYAMYFDLQDPANAEELALWRLRPHLPSALYALLTHPGSSFDAPLQGQAFGDAPLPAADQVDLRRLPAPPPSARAAGGPQRRDDRAELQPGSNSFAVSGALTADGRAIVADDMHLALRAPNLWFRARLRWPDAAAPGGRVDVQGLTLPGLPAVVVGSNGHVAWGYTNSYGDFLDWALEKPCDKATVAPPDGCAPVLRHPERIAVAGAEPVALEVRETGWGPALHTLPDGRVLSLRWTAHLPGSINLGLTGFARAGDVDAALAAGHATAIPTQNLVIGDRDGRIAWRLLGPLPRREPGCQAAVPTLPAADTHARTPTVPAKDTHAPAPTAHSAQAAVMADAACPPWDFATDASPLAASPQFDRLWTANARTVDGAALARIGDGGYAHGARAAQIRDALRARGRFTEADLLAIQLDDRALLMTRWWTLLQAQRDAGPALDALADAATPWDGRASVDSASYRIVRGWRQAVQARLRDGLLAPARVALGATFQAPALPQFEAVAWPLVQAQPAHLLPAGFASWGALFEDAAREVRDELERLGPLPERHWGERNTAAICHPLAAALPLGRRLLCMPADRLPGDTMMPRVQAPAFGASQRMVVAPGHEADGLLHMPGGQSGHRLSPFWGAGHDDWVHGRPSPFLPGAPRHRLLLAPAASEDRQ